MDLDHLVACGNHDVKVKEENKCKSRGSLHNTRTYPNRRRNSGAPHPAHPMYRQPRRLPTALPTGQSILFTYGHFDVEEGGRSVPPRNPSSR